jgi:chemotaxis protein MotB
MMRRSSYRLGQVLVALLIISFISGCAVKFQKRHPQDIRKIQELTEELQEMNHTMALLRDRLKEEIKRGEVSVEREERGIVVTFVAEVLFDSGKAKIRKEGLEALKKVASVLKDVENDISIEGHTDNVPIKYSGWKSNWELSAARALSVLHYLVDKKGLNPQKVSATGYGEYRPIASNDTPQGRQKNRRVEIIIRPRLVKGYEKQNPEKIK